MDKLLEKIGKMLKGVIDAIAARIAKNYIELIYLNKEKLDDLELYGEEYADTLVGSVTNLKISYKEFKIVFMLSILGMLNKFKLQLKKVNLNRI